jgi:hypothetical protein
VGRFLSKLAKALTGEGGAEEAREALIAAQEVRSKLKIEQLRTHVRNATIMTAMIEGVGDNDFVITQPVIGGVARSLVVSESLRISFAIKGIGAVSGEVEVLGRHKIPAGNGSELQGYLLTLPLELFPDERRENKRGGAGINLAREVELYRDERHKPIRGVVQNLSLGGLQIRTHDTPDPPLRPGERVRVSVHLPSPVGLINRMVTIARLAGAKNPRHRVIGIAFEREIEGLRDLLSKGAE